MVVWGFWGREIVGCEDLGGVCFFGLEFEWEDLCFWGGINEDGISVWWFIFLDLRFRRGEDCYGEIVVRIKCWFELVIYGK